MSGPAIRQSAGISFELHELACLDAIVTYNSVTIAAQKLHIAQPAVSRKLRHLEAVLDTKLFKRGHNRMTLTPAGERLAIEGRHILELCQHVEWELARLFTPEPERGRFSTGVAHGGPNIKSTE